MTYDNHIFFIGHLGKFIEDSHTSSKLTYPKYDPGHELSARKVSLNFPNVNSIVICDCLYTSPDDLCTDPGDPCTDPNDLCARVLGNLLIIQQK